MNHREEAGLLAGFVVVLICAALAMGAAGLRLFVPLLHHQELASDEVIL